MPGMEKNSDNKIIWKVLFSVTRHYLKEHGNEWNFSDFGSCHSNSAISAKLNVPKTVRDRCQGWKKFRDPFLP